MTQLDLLGSGNAFLPSGRLHSLLLINQHIMIDCPPTTLASLRNAKVSPADIDTILITHLHADHVFGFPSFILERKYISDRSGEKQLTIAGSKNVRQRLELLCELAYPGSLDSMLSKINWIDIPESDIWTFERFKVRHDPKSEPHGWMMTHKNGWSILHSGDSGPCEELWNRVKLCKLVVIEMSVPETVDTQSHHKPSEISKLANDCPDTQFLLTHTYIDIDYKILTTDSPDLPNNVTIGKDNLSLTLDENGKISNFN